jgi:hypothetical protein
VKNGMYLWIFLSFGGFFVFFLITKLDAPPSSLMDSTTNPKVKTTEGEKIGVRSLTHNISKVKGHVGTSGWGLGRLTSNSITRTNMHKPNNKLVSA